MPCHSYLAHWFLHRIAHTLLGWHVPLLPRLIYGFSRIVFSVVLPPSVVVGEGVVLGYSLVFITIMVHPGSAYFWV